MQGTFNTLSHGLIQRYSTDFSTSYAQNDQKQGFSGLFVGGLICDSIGVGLHGGEVSS